MLLEDLVTRRSPGGWPTRSPASTVALPAAGPTSTVLPVTLRRLPAVAMCTAGLLLATAAPALATSKTDDGNEPRPG